MDAAAVPYENVKDNFEVEVAANANGENGGGVVEEKEDPFRTDHVEVQKLVSLLQQGCQMAKFDPFLSLDCARVEGVGAQSKERKGSNFAA